MEGRPKRNYFGLNITVFYDDGTHVSRKDGVCTGYAPSEIILDDRIIIPWNRIVRIELQT